MVHWDFSAQPSLEFIVNGLKNRKSRQLQVDTKATLICKDSPKLDKRQIKNMPNESRYMLQYSDDRFKFGINNTKSRIHSASYQQCRLVMVM